MNTNTAARHTGHAVRVQVFTRGNQLKVQERTFTTAAAAVAWVEKLDREGKLNQVLAWSDPQ